MKHILLVLLFLSCLSAVIADETTIILNSKTEVPFYKIESFAIDPVSRSLVNDYDVHYKNMTLAAISPARITVDNGDYIFAITDSWYNRVIPIKARGDDIHISIRPTAPHAAYVLVGAALSLVGSVQCAANVTVVDGDQSLFGDPWFYAAAAFGMLTTSGVVWWLNLLPRVVIE